MEKDVDDDEFISMMCLWVYKNATYPLELINFLQAKNGEKVIAIQDYVGGAGSHLYLGKKSYSNYQSALTKVGALMDKMDYPGSLNIYKSSHPLSCPIFYSGYNSQNDDTNPYEESTD